MTESNNAGADDLEIPRERTRRDFLVEAGRWTAGIAAGAAIVGTSGCATTAPPTKFAHAPSQAPRAEGEKIRLGFIGVGGRGRNLLQHFVEIPDAEITALCDAKKSSIAEALKMVPNAKTPTFENYHDVISREDVDAVVIATPDHWHAIIAIEACQAGKDVYVEKPLALCVEEGRRVVQAARKHGRVVQLGTQQLSGTNYAEARKIVQGGELGRVTIVRVWNLRNTVPRHPAPPDEATAPADINWDLWLGPRELVPYNPMKASGAFRHFWEYAGGILTDWGVHHYHSILDIMGYDAPLSVSATGGRFIINDITTVPDTLSAIYQFKTWMMEYMSSETNGKAPYGSEYGIEFCGDKATMFLDRKGYIITPETDRKNPIKVGEAGEDNFLPPQLDDIHTRNFIRCVRTRENPASEIENGHIATTLAHLGNIAYRTGRQVRWDGVNERIIGDAEADALLRRQYRKPYLLPEV